MKITEDDLEALVRWDAKLVEDIELLRQGTAELLRTVDLGADARDEIRNLERGVDSMIEDYNQRDTIMKGFDSQEADA